MGKGKKKFIEKGKGQHFVVLHRSRLDESHANEEAPSDMVLVPSKGPVNLTEVFNHPKDYIGPFGFKNDGYDYSQHMKEMGGGQFVSKDGKVMNSSDVLPAANRTLDLPDDVFASVNELERHFQAITISSEYMDEDIRAALFDESGEEFEELDDNFVSEAMREPEVPDFDFDAHIAHLLELSERSLNANGKRAEPRGWDQNDVKGRFLPRKNRLPEDEYVSRGKFKTTTSLVDDDFDDEDEFDEELLGEESDRHCGAMDNESDFDKLLEEYEDDKLGYPEDDDKDEQVEDGEGGSRTIDVTLETADRYFDQAMDEFLEVVCCS